MFISFLLLISAKSAHPISESDSVHRVPAVASYPSVSSPDIEPSFSSIVSISSSTNLSFQQIDLHLLSQTCINDTKGAPSKRPFFFPVPESMEAVAFAKMDDCEGGVFVRDIRIQNPKHVHLNPTNTNSNSIIYNLEEFLSLLNICSSIDYCKKYYENPNIQLLFIKDTVFYNILQLAALFSSETQVIATLKEQKSFIRWTEVEKDLKKLTEDEIEQVNDDAETFSERIEEAIYGSTYSDDSPFNYSGPWGLSEKADYIDFLEYKCVNAKGFVLLLVEVFWF